jgi:hypothetical protein
MGWKTDLVAEGASFTFAESAGRMIAQSARKGFSVPFSGAFGARDWASKKLGIKLAGWGAIGESKGVATASQAALGMFEKAGLRGMIFGGAGKAVTGKFGSKISKDIAFRYLLGRGAGMLMGAANIAMFGAMAIQGTVMGYQAISGAVQQHKGLELGGHFMDSQGAATSRQRALKAITASSLQARSAIGNEAMLMHR